MSHVYIHIQCKIVTFKQAATVTLKVLEMYNYATFLALALSLKMYFLIKEAQKFTPLFTKIRKTSHNFSVRIFFNYIFFSNHKTAA